MDIKGEAFGIHVKRKHEKLDEYAHTHASRLIQYAAEEMTCLIGKSPTHFRVNFLESPGAKEKRVVLI